MQGGSLAVSVLLLYSTHLVDLVFAGLTWVASCVGAGLNCGAMQGGSHTTPLGSTSAPGGSGDIVMSFLLSAMPARHCSATCAHVAALLSGGSCFAVLTWLTRLGC